MTFSLVQKRQVSMLAYHIIPRFYVTALPEYKLIGKKGCIVSVVLGLNIFLVAENIRSLDQL